MAIAVDPKQVHRYVSEEDRKLPVEQQTVFPYRAQTFRVEKEATDLSQDRKFWDSSMCTLRNCLDKWENFMRPDGTEVPWETDADGLPSRATICRIGATVRNELLRAINGLGTSQLTETDLGN